MNRSATVIGFVNSLLGSKRQRQNERCGRSAQRMHQSIAAAIEPLESRVLMSVSIIATKSQAFDVNANTTGKGVFTFTRTGATTQPLQVDFAVSAASTASPSRYMPLPADVIIPAGKKSTTLEVHPIFDAPPKPTETLVLTVSALPSYVVNPAHATAAIKITDKAPSVSITAAKPHASEKDPTTKGQGQFLVRRTGGNAQALTVNYMIGAGSTAINGVDFQPLTGSATIPQGKSSVFIDVTPIADHLMEPTRSLTLDLGLGSYFATAKKSSATVTIADDGSSTTVRNPVVDVTTVSDASEANPSIPGQFLVTRRGATTGALTVNYTVGGSAVAGTDYAPLSGSVIIPSGQAAATVNVTPLGDHTSADRTVVLTLTNSGEPTAASTTATVTLAKNPSTIVTPGGPLIHIAVAADASEASPGTPGRVVVSVPSPLTTDLTVDYSVAGTAVAGTDYSPLSGSVIIPAGQTSATINVVPTGSQTANSTTVVLTLSNSGESNAALTSATLTIEANSTVNPGNPASHVAVAANASEAGSGTAGSFLVTIPAASAGNTTIAYTLAGTAVAGTDYTPLSGSVVIPAGQTSATVTVTPINHTASADKTVILTLTGSSEPNPALTSATLTITAAGSSTVPAGWFDTAYHNRLPISVNVGSTARVDKPVDYSVNFTQALSALGRSGALNENSIRVVETTADGQTVLNPNVPFQFDKDANYDAASQASGDLVFLMTGNTAANATRYYHVYYDTGSGFTAPTVTPIITTNVNAMDAGQAAITVTTPEATYSLQTDNGGFSSIIDKNGNNWLSFNPASGSGSGGEYRGLPNAVINGGLHAGFNFGSTQVVSTGPLKTTLLTTISVPTGLASGNSTYVVKYEIYPSYVTTTIIRADDNYWFLYEGTPGGTLPDNTMDLNNYSVQSDGTQTNITQSFSDPNGLGASNGMDWIYFESAAESRYLFMVKNQSTNQPDEYLDLNNQMTVFGFGRQNENSNYHDAHTLTAAPNVFTFGLAEGGTDFAAASTQINGTYQPLTAMTGVGQGIS